LLHHLQLTNGWQILDSIRRLFIQFHLRSHWRADTSELIDPAMEGVNIVWA
jgi:hypothetical protein